MLGLSTMYIHHGFQKHLSYVATLFPRMLSICEPFFQCNAIYPFHHYAKP